MSIFHFIALQSTVIVNQSTAIDVPTQLTSKLDTHDWILGIILFTSFILLALAKQFEPHLFNQLFRSFFTFGTPESLSKLEIKTTSRGYVFLGLHFFLNLWACFILLLKHKSNFVGGEWILSNYELSELQLTVSALLISLLIFVYLFAGFFITAFVSGEYALIRIFATQTWINGLFFGILLFIVGVIWSLNPQFTNYLNNIFIYLIASFLIIRLIKVSIASLLEGISWYYIILYLCTLEILPLIVVYRYIA